MLLAQFWNIYVFQPWSWKKWWHFLFAWWKKFFFFLLLAQSMFVDNIYIYTIYLLHMYPFFCCWTELNIIHKSKKKKIEEKSSDTIIQANIQWLAASKNKQFYCHAPPLYHGIPPNDWQYNDQKKNHSEKMHIYWSMNG